MESSIKIVLFLSFLSLSQCCQSKFKNGSQFFTTILSQCAFKLKIIESEFDKLQAMVKDPDTDDKCLSQCMLEKLEMINEAGKLDRDAVFDFIEDQAPNLLKPKLTEIVTKCADGANFDKIKTVEKKTEKKPKNTNDNEACQAFHQFYSCFDMGSEKLC